MSVVDDFNQILKDRAAWEKNLGVPMASQWADWTMNILARPGLKETAVTSGAAALLTFAWDKLQEQRAHDMENDRNSAAWRPDVYAWLAPLETLLDPGSPATSDSDVEHKLATFAAAAFPILEEQQASAGDTDPTPDIGIIASAVIPAGGLVGNTQRAWPDVSLLWSQVKPLLPLLRAMGRQTAPQDWSEWFAAKLDAVKNAIPALAQMGLWTGLGAVINHLLDVGLIPIMGTNVITFGANLLTPLKALIDFPGFMKKQAILYSLREYGLKKLRLPTTSPVIQAIDHAISSFDWAAVRVAFQVTPAALLISVYSGVKFVALKAKPSAGYYHDDAQTLIQVADTVQTGQTQENKLALMTLLHLAGSYEAFLTIMTERIDSAYEDVSRAMDV